jgi:hypothetical protein
MKKLFALSVVFFIFASCDAYEYGRLGGADRFESLFPGGGKFEQLLSSLSGVWYSHYAGMGRLDGYRIGKWKDFDALMAGKTALFPNLERKTYTTETGSDTPDGEDFFVLYDDTVYGQTDDTAPARAGWGFAYCGIVRAVNIFNNDTNRGAIIIEYLRGCAPRWLEDTQGLRDGEKPFFGINYRVVNPDTVQMANAVDLAAMYAGKNYYTETGHLDEAVAANTIEHEAEYISWGVVIPQDREK